jgi:hypothetical protein
MLLLQHNGFLQLCGLGDIRDRERKITDQLREIESCKTIVYLHWSVILRKSRMSLCHKVCQIFAAGRWFFPGTPVSSSNKTDPHDIAEIFLKVVLNIITLTLSLY